MFDLLDLDDSTGRGTAGLAPPPLSYLGPERRRHHRPDSRWLSLMLEEVGHGTLLLSDKAFVLHANHLARSLIETGNHALQVVGRQLLPRNPREHGGWHEALDDARRGLRRLLMLGDGGLRGSVAVVPLTPIDGHRLTMITMARRQLSDPVALQCFARCHGLTAAETRVLECLCQGIDPVAIAQRHGVGIATVRTQISSIRHKTGSADITGLVRLAAGLPPMASVLRGGAVRPMQ